MSDSEIIRRLNEEFDTEKKKIISDFSKDIAAKEQELKDYKAKSEADIIEKKYKSKMSDLEKKVKEFETEKRDVKVKEFMTDLEKKGLIAKDGKEEVGKIIKEFSAEQLNSIDSLIGKFSMKDFKASKGKETGTGDFAKKKEDLEKKILNLEKAGVGGPVLKEYKTEMKKLEGSEE